MHHGKGGGACVHFGDRRLMHSTRTFWCMSQPSCLKQDSLGKNLFVLTLCPSTGTSLTSCGKACSLTGSECERCTGRLSIIPSGRCWKAWRTLSRSQGRRSGRLSSICCPTTEVPVLRTPVVQPATRRRPSFFGSLMRSSHADRLYVQSLDQTGVESEHF